MKKTAIGMALVALVLMALALYQGGSAELLDGLWATGKMVLIVTPMLLFAFIVAGLIQHIVSKETIERFLGTQSGFKGILLGAIAGGLIPGGPYVYLPIAASFLVGGANIGVVMAFIVAKNLWSFSRLPMELALLGVEITAVRFALTAAFPLLVGLLAERVYRGAVPGIREQIAELMAGKEQPLSLPR